MEEGGRGMQFRRASSGELITLSSASLVGSGGEARIYAVQKDPALVAKIYHAPSATHGLKLAAMLANPPDDPMRAHGHASIAWPVDLLQGELSRSLAAGFLMPRVTGARPIIDFYNPKTRREQAPLFNYLYLHRTAHNLAAAFRALHDHGYVIGDVRESNILVNGHTLVTLVDTDSFQVRDPASGVVYRCPVGTAEFTPRELHGKDFASLDRAPEHDLFGLAVLLFQLLMEGIHPFAGVYLGSGDPPPYEARVALGHFPHGTRRCPYRPVASALPFSILDPDLRRLFLRCFEEGHADPKARPDADTWQTALEEAEQHLAACSTNDQHRYGRHLKSCPWCERAARLGGRDPFPSRRAVREGQVLPQLVPRPRLRPGRALPVLPGVGLPGPTRHNPVAWLGIWLAVIGVLTLVVPPRHLGFLLGAVVCGTAAAVCGIAGRLRARRMGGTGRLAAGWAAGLGVGVTLFAVLLAGFWEEDGDVTGWFWRKARETAEQRKGPTSPWAFDAAEAKRRQDEAALKGPALPWPFGAATATRAQDEAARKLGVSVQHVADLGNGVSLSFVLIPPGEFDMGRPHGEYGGFDDERLHRVTIPEAFWIGQYLVTQEQWKAVMGSNPSRFKGDRNPVENVSWTDCQDFVGRLNARGGKGRFALPTEAQWEWACRAGSSAGFSFGDQSADLGEYAWYSGNSAGTTHPVGQKKPNAWGLYDMHGNVWEWVASPYSYDYDGSETQGASVGSGDRVLRGGSRDNGPWYLGSAFRFRLDPRVRTDIYGFRVVWLAPEGTPSVTAAPPVEPPTERKWPFGAAEAKRRQEEAAWLWGIKTEEDIDLGKGVKLSLVLIPAGKFFIGSPAQEWDRGENEAQKQVVIEDPFWIGRCGVTQELWHAIMGTDPSTSKGPKKPVEQVSWDDAQKFVEALNARVPGARFSLPTEAQWEWACRAGAATRFSFGEGEERLGEYAWYFENSGDVTHPVGEKKPNTWGIHDMPGNVFEWCASPYSRRYDGSELRGADAPGPVRVLRGAAFCLTPSNCRSAARRGCEPTVATSITGFRVSRAIAKAAPRVPEVAERPKVEAWLPPWWPERPKVEAKPPEPKQAPKVEAKPTEPKQAPKVEPKAPPPPEPPKPEVKIPRPIGELKFPARDWPFNAKEAEHRQNEAAKKKGKKKEEEVDIGNGAKLVLVLIPEGEFKIGSPTQEEGRKDNEAQKSVSIEKSFWMGKYEVTQEQWKAVMGDNPSAFEGAKLPVDKVSWNDAQEFVKRLNASVEGGGFALPTEAQWEYACRAGSAARFSLGDTVEALDESAWQRANSGDVTHPVGEKKPNAWGLYDMHGNVWEWCASPYFDLYGGNELEGAEAPALSRVLRGGSWGSDPGSCRSACRSYAVPTDATNSRGFRVVRALK